MSTKVEESAKQDFLEEVSEWIEAFDDVIAEDWTRGAELLAALKRRAREAGVATPSELITPYRNTIPKHDEVPYPGDRSLERRVEALIRWNAMAMVHCQNKKDPGHRRTYFDLLFAGDAAGGWVQSLLQGEVSGRGWRAGAAGRFYLLSGTCFAGSLCAGLSGGAV